MTREELAEFIKNDSGIVLFYSNKCSVCDTQKTLFERAIPNSYSMICCDEDPEWFIQNHNIDLIPVTRIYEFGNIVWEKLDLLHPEDVEFLIDYVSTK